jgi:hypothetical protein
VSGSAQRARRSDDFATRIRRRSARLTDWSSGKCSATSGDKSARFVPALYRAAYLPQTPPRNLHKSYSRRSSSRVFRFSARFFIIFSLAPGRFACAYDPECFTAIGVSHNQQPLALRDPDCNKPPLGNRMIRILKRYRQRVAKNRRRFVKRNSMLSKVARCLARVPFKVHGMSLSRTCRGTSPRVKEIVRAAASNFNRDWSPTGYGIALPGQLQNGPPVRGPSTKLGFAAAPRPDYEGGAFLRSERSKTRRKPHRFSIAVDRMDIRCLRVTRGEW